MVLLKYNAGAGYCFLQELLFSYNIAVDRSDEMKKTLRKSAGSVGLQLPEVYQPWWSVGFE